MIVSTYHYQIFLGNLKLKASISKTQEYSDIKCWTNDLRGIAAANLSASSISLCLSSCLPMLGGPMRTIGLL